MKVLNNLRRFHRIKEGIAGKFRNKNNHLLVRANNKGVAVGIRVEPHQAVGNRGVRHEDRNPVEARAARRPQDGGQPGELLIRIFT